MKYLLVILLITFSLQGIAQVQDTTHVSQYGNGHVGKLRKKLAKVTSLLNGDSVKLNTTSRDSVLHQQTEKKDSLAQQVSTKLDSLQNIGLKAGLENKTDSLQQLAEKPLDELQEKLAIPGEVVRSKTDSINGLLNKPSQAAEEELGKVDDKIDKVDNKISSVSDSLNHAIEKRAKSLEEEAQEKINDINPKAPNMPNIKTGAIPETGINADVPQVPAVEGLNVPQSDVTLPGVETGDLNVGDVNITMPEMNDLGEIKTPDIPDVNAVKKLGDVQKATGELNKVDGKLAEADKVEAELNNIKQGKTEGVEKEAENRLTNVQEVQALSSEKAKALAKQAEYDALIKKYRDKKLMQEEIVRKSKNVVNDKLNKFSPAVKEAQEQLSKAKRLRPKVTSVKDMLKNHPNAMKGKPFRERILPGITLQVYNNSPVTIDWETRIGYRLTGRLNVGLGGVYRIGISDQYELLVKSLNVYGGRFYADFTIKKSIYAHGEFELLSFQSAAPGPEPKEHIVAGNFGLGKSFNISRRFKGHIMGLYRMEYEGHLPGINKVNLRLGFEYVLKKKANSSR